MTKLTTLETLVQAKALIADPQHWLKGDYDALNANGDTCYCSVGAIAKVADFHYGDAHQCEAVRLLRKVVLDEGVEDRDFACYNDSHTHEEVMNAFDKAIAKAKANEDFYAKIEAELDKA